MASQNKKRTYKQQAIYRFIVLAAILVLLNIVSSNVHNRTDLTADKRYTLNDSTILMLKNLKDRAFVDVYLTGDMSSGFKRLETATRDMLNQFRAYAGDNIGYQFIDLLKDKSDEEKKQIYQEMSSKGLAPFPDQTEKNDAYSERLIIPGAIIHYGGREASVKLLVNDAGVEAHEALNNSVARIENKFSATLKKLSSDERVKVGIVRGNGELPLINMYDIIGSLSDFYQVDTINLSSVISIPTKYKAIIIAKPSIPFNAMDKFKIDQYVMHSGNVLWLLNGVQASMDSVQLKSSFLAMNAGLGLDDQLFTYGCRINPSLLMDLQSNPVPVKDRYFPFFYFPVITPLANHIITKELGPVYTVFPSTMDTVKAPGIKKTILLSSSRKSKEVYSPWLVDLRDIKNKPDESSFNKSFLTLGVLLEGKFTSVFNNRVDPQFETILRDSLKTPFLGQGLPSKQIVISSGDIIKNDFSPKYGPISLGFYYYTKQFFANKNFILNCIDYLADRPDQIITRAKEVKLRLLDTQKVKEEKTKWQAINIVLPIVIIILFGLGYSFIRLRRYAV